MKYFRSEQHLIEFVLSENINIELFMPHAVSLTDTSTLVSLCMDKSFLENYSSQKGTEILEMVLLSPKIQKQITKLQTELLLHAVSYVYELHYTHKEEIQVKPSDPFYP